MKKVISGLVLLVLMLAMQTAYAANDFKLSKNEYKTTAIVCPKTKFVASFAAQELQKHLNLITGNLFPIATDKGTFKKVFYVGIVPAQDKKALEADEARYLVTSDAVYIYGEDNISGKPGDSPTPIVNTSAGRRGTLFAVYDFLEYELGVKWLQPGDAGIIYEQKDELSIPGNSHSWMSPFKYARGMRAGNWASSESVDGKIILPDAFKMTEAESSRKYFETNLWLRRMRMGNRGTKLSFGHAFGDWWVKYGEAHPEYFALNGRNVRGTMKSIERVKMCVSNQDVVKTIVDNWLAARAAGNTTDVINGCENDGNSNGLAEFCHCENCIALDYLEPGEKFGANLTDRYVDFWNRIVTLARTHVPTARVCGYAYSYYMTPPRKTRVADGVVLGFVTRFGDDKVKTQSVYEGWKAMGAKEIYFRPNDLNAELGLPLGTGKQMVDHLQMAIKFGAEGIDQDSLFNFWSGISGPVYYTLAKSFTDTNKPYEYWEDEYASAFGPAKDDIKAYLTHWRVEVNGKRLAPADAANRKSGKNGLLGYSVVRGFAPEINKYYNENDFDITDGYLKSALSKKLSPSQKNFVNSMLTANMHNRLSYEAMLAKSTKSDNQAQASKALLDYRIAHKDDLFINWAHLFTTQNNFGDICGVTRLLASSK